MFDIYVAILWLQMTSSVLKKSYWPVCIHSSVYTSVSWCYSHKSVFSDWLWPVICGERCENNGYKFIRWRRPQRCFFLLTTRNTKRSLIYYLGCCTNFHQVPVIFHLYCFINIINIHSSIAPQVVLHWLYCHGRFVILWRKSPGRHQAKHNSTVIPTPTPECCILFKTCFIY